MSDMMPPANANADAVWPEGARRSVSFPPPIAAVAVAAAAAAVAVAVAVAVAAADDDDEDDDVIDVPAAEFADDVDAGAAAAVRRWRLRITSFSHWSSAWYVASLEESQTNMNPSQPA
jgi:hypothetical protein